LLEKSREIEKEKSEIDNLNKIIKRLEENTEKLEKKMKLIKMNILLN